MIQFEKKKSFGFQLIWVVAPAARFAFIGLLFTITTVLQRLGLSDYLDLNVQLKLDFVGD